MKNPLFGAMKSLAILSTLLLGACAGSSSYMRDVTPEKANYTAQTDKALVVFMRPSTFGFAIQSPVFETTDGNPRFVAIVSAKTKVAYYTSPGNKRFMVVGESADFMDAQLKAGKIYYALVTPRMGLWKARFSLRPIHADGLKTEEFAGWYKDTRWVENLSTGAKWASSNMPSVQGKMEEYLPVWLKKAEKPKLATDDGRTRPFTGKN
jgi:hypothetical protein